MKYALTEEPLVSVIIPNKDSAETLKECLDALLTLPIRISKSSSLKITARERSTFEYYRQLSQNEHIHLVRWKKSLIIPLSIITEEICRRQVSLFLNNDVRGTISDGWLTEMLSVCQREDVRAVGAKLYYPNKHIQHAGIVVGMGGIAGAMFTDLPKQRSGYMHKASLMQGYERRYGCLYAR